jgi:uncharacterized protein YpmB
MYKIYNEKKGVSLIILIITIIIMLIIAGSIILNTSSSKTIQSAKNAALKSDFQTMLDNYNSVRDDLIYNNGGDESALEDSDFEGKNIINSKYSSIFKVTKDGLVYIGNDSDEIKVAKELGISVE